MSEKRATRKKAPAKKSSKKRAAKSKRKPSSKAKRSSKKKKAPARKPVRAAVAKTKASSVASASVHTTLLQEGSTAPSIRLMTQSRDGQPGELITLDSFKGQRVIVYFYPKDDTPGCTQEACDFRDSMPEFDRLNSVVLGISKDSSESHEKFRRKYELPFHLLADIDGKVCEAYGVWKEKSMYGRKYMGIERATFVIDPAGKVEKVYPKVSVSTHIEEILQHLKKGNP